MKKLLIGAAFLAACVLALPLLAIPMFASVLTSTSTSTDESSCTDAGSPSLTVTVDMSKIEVPKELAGMTPDQLAVAAVIMQAGADAGVGERGQLVGIMTAIQEADLGRDTTSKLPNGDGDAGVFQQRVLAGWYGSLDMVNDPYYAATAFFNGVTATEKGGWGSVGGGAGNGHLPGLKDIKGWETMTLTKAAQSVQRSAFPDAYAKHEAVARQIMASLAGVPVTSANGTPTGGTLDCTGGAAVSTATGTVKSVIDYAKSWEGKGLTYHMGGGNLDGPTGNTFDCSSFVGAAWKQGAGVTFGRSAQDQWNNLAAYRVGVTQMQPGDLIFEAAGRRGGVGRSDAVSHVAMYLGDGKLIEWGHSRNGFNIGPTAGRVDASAFVGVARPPAPTAAEGDTP